MEEFEFIGINKLIDIHKEITDYKTGLLKLIYDNIYNFEKIFHNKPSEEGVLFKIHFGHVNDPSYIKKFLNSMEIDDIRFIYKNNSDYAELFLSHDSKLGENLKKISLKEFSIEDLETLLNHIYTEILYKLEKSYRDLSDEDKLEILKYTKNKKNGNT
jgi:hypothetical protein